MAFRTYVCPVIGTGTEEDPFRAIIHADRINHSAHIPSDQDGRPIDPWCVVTINEADHDKALSRTGVEAVADFDAGKRAVEAKRGAVR